MSRKTIGAILGEAQSAIPTVYLKYQWKTEFMKSVANSKILQCDKSKSNCLVTLDLKRGKGNIATLCRAKVVPSKIDEGAGSTIPKSLRFSSNIPF